jgi:alkylation response protein AidB-like acyl-CoA dehydrogenase
MDFGFSEMEQMVMDMSVRFTEKWLADCRDHEAQQGIPDAVRKAFLEAGLTDIAADGEEADEISWPARCAVIENIAGGDAATAMALWMRSMAPVLARRMGVDADLADGLSFVHIVDDATGCTQLPWLPLDGEERVLLADYSGCWALVEVEAVATHALALHAASPVHCTVGEHIAKGQAAEAVRSAIAELRLMAAALLVGISRGAQEYAAEYMQTRRTFGKTLNQHQGLAFIFSDMAIATDGARLLLQKCASIDGRPSTDAADAYLEAVEAAIFVTQNGVQLLGGHGFMKDHPVEKWMREARALSLLWGGVDAARRDAIGGVR